MNQQLKYGCKWFLFFIFLTWLCSSFFSSLYYSFARCKGTNCKLCYSTRGLPPLHTHLPSVDNKIWNICAWKSKGGVMKGGGAAYLGSISPWLTGSRRRREPNETERDRAPGGTETPLAIPPPRSEWQLGTRHWLFARCPFLCYWVK